MTTYAPPPITVPRAERIAAALAKRAADAAAQAEQEQAATAANLARFKPPLSIRKATKPTTLEPAAIEIIAAAQSDAQFALAEIVTAGEIVVEPETVEPAWAEIKMAPLSNLAMQGSDTDWTALTDKELGDRLRKSFSALGLHTRAAQAEMRAQMLPAIEEAQRRFKAGHKVDGFGSITAFYIGNGLNPNTVYSWESRARKDASNEAVRLFESGEAHGLPPELRERAWSEWTKKRRKDNEQEKAKIERERLDDDPIARLKVSMAAIRLDSDVRAVMRVTHQTRASITDSQKQRKELGKLLRTKSKELEYMRMDLLNDWSKEDEAERLAEDEDELEEAVS